MSRIRRTIASHEVPLTDIDDHKWEIERERIDQLYMIGKGNFGEVHKGFLLSKSDEES
jgi:hypothetical protein